MITGHRCCNPVQARGGFSLVELVVVLALLALCGEIIGSTLIRQQRFYRGASEVLHAREGVTDAMEVLAADIRRLSRSDTVRLMADSAFEFFSTIGGTVACAGSSPSQILLAASAGARGNTLGSFATLPDTGDLALLYVDAAPGKRQWQRVRTLSFALVANAGTCLGSSEGADRVGYSLRLVNAPPAPVAPGTPVRFVRRGRYSLYRASDGEWYLGYRRCDALGVSSCGSIQPVSGPYKPYNSGSFATGLLFEYYDAAGGKLGGIGSASSLARVDITARARSHQRIASDGRALSFGDSGRVSIAIRN